MASLRNKILDLVSATGGKITGLEIERFSMANGQKGATGGRRARELAEDGLIKAGYDGNWVYYTRTEPEKTYKLVAEFTDRGSVIIKKVSV